MTAELTRLCVTNDLYVFANASGNLNPMHLSTEDGDADGTVEAVAASMWLGARLSPVLGNHLLGPGTLYRGQSLRFMGRVLAGDEATENVTITELTEDGGVRLETWGNAPTARVSPRAWLRSDCHPPTPPATWATWATCPA
ncbi:MAG: MaoC/PaaZ C-terminal domain-containing protein [Pseudomonadota bacterium]